MEQEYIVKPIAVVRNEIHEPVDDVFGGLISRVELDASRFTPEALRGLADYSHVEVVFLLDRVAERDIEYGARRPRGRQDWPVTGIFAQRAKLRPNRLAVTVCGLRSVQGLTIEVEALDAIDGTPVIDLKPWVAEFGPRGEVRQPSWMSELMAGYWREV